jgi:tRNA splicing ligase
MKIFQRWKCFPCGDLQRLYHSANIIIGPTGNFWKEWWVISVDYLQLLHNDVILVKEGSEDMGQEFLQLLLHISNIGARFTTVSIRLVMDTAFPDINPC